MVVSAQPVHGVGPDGRQEHDIIHLGGETAVVVPVEEYRMLPALAQRATAQELADAEDEAALEDWQAPEASGRTSYITLQEFRGRLGLAE